MTEHKISESYQELFRFAEEYGLSIVLDKPFKEMPQLILKVRYRDKDLEQVVLDDIAELGEKSAELLNSLSQNV